MSTRLKDKEEKIQQIITKLIEESAKGKLVVVEGKKDEVALQELGVSGKFLTVKTGGKSFLDTVSEIEKMEAKGVILLLDFDRRGKEGTNRLKQSLERAKMKPNTKFWREISATVGKEIQCIESLPNYLQTLETKINISPRK